MQKFNELPKVYYIIDLSLWTRIGKCTCYVILYSSNINKYIYDFLLYLYFSLSKHDRGYCGT